jgi:hypothetical protein
MLNLPNAAKDYRADPLRYVVTRCRSLPSDANKHLPAVEPPAEGPEDSKDEEA